MFRVEKRAYCNAPPLGVSSEAEHMTSAIDYPAIYRPREDVTLYRGDCLTILPTLTGVDAVVTDPPYGTQGLGEGYGRRQLHDPSGRIGAQIANDTDLSAIAAAFPLCLALVSNGWAFVFYAPRRTPQFAIATQAGEWFGGIVWDKGAPGLGYHIRYQHEDIAVFRVGEPTRPKDALLSIVRGAAMSEKHPHEKPPKILAPLVTWGTECGGTVLDPFMGSGTTGIACIRTGRRFIGIEIDPTHYATACRRIDDELQQIKLDI